MHTTLTIIATITTIICFAIAKLYQWFQTSEIERDLDEYLNN